MNLVAKVRSTVSPFYQFVRNPKKWIRENREARLLRAMESTPVGSTNSEARDIWVAAALSEIPGGLRILDAGAGEQRYRKDCAHLQYVSQDHEAYDGSGDGLGGQVTSWTYGKTDLVSDICSIPAGDASFDAVLCTEVLEHVPDPVRALAELTRLLKPGGYLIVTAPFCSLTHFSPYHFSTGLSKYWYQHHLQALGYENIQLVPNGNYFEYMAQELRRLTWVSSVYVRAPVPHAERRRAIRLMKYLETCSAEDSGSSEYLCYGWHVKARKSCLAAGSKP